MLFTSASLVFYMLAFLNVVIVGKKAASNLRGQKTRNLTNSLRTEMIYIHTAYINYLGSSSSGRVTLLFRKAIAQKDNSYNNVIVHSRNIPKLINRKHQRALLY